GRLERDVADKWADQMMEVTEKNPKNLILVVSDMARSNPPMTTSFVSELVRRLQGQGSALALPLTWIEQHLAESSLTIEQLVQSGNQQQAADQVSVSNSIGSLRFLGAMDWREFVETMSVVDQILRKDPLGTYSEMDFGTRDRYRHVIEQIAKSSPLSEADLAQTAIRMASNSASHVSILSGSGERASHVGFYLVDKGRLALEEAAQMRLSKIDALCRRARRSPLTVYLGCIALISLICTGVLIAAAYTGGAPNWLLVLAGALTLVATSQFAVALVNWLATLIVTPVLLPRMNYSDGIPAEARTLTVVPTMLTNIQDVDDLVENLEVRFLGNRDDHLHFALLTDFRDAQEETLPEDGALVQHAAARIAALNEKYCGSASESGVLSPRNVFFLFHRPRRWNPQERLWMGYERKRGKLADLNALLRGRAGVDGKDCFSLIVGEIAVLSNVKYVITLDTDTQLPRDAARQFIGTMAHPLNRPRFNTIEGQAGREHVVEGYGILQPRVAVSLPGSLPGSRRSYYGQLFGGEPGIDPYTRAISDVYQDVFHEGSFIGKGIYDVDAFERALNGRFPDNRILSHDLIEGCYARSGLLSDVQLYEEYPSRYSADVSRRHRWIRGDWQLLPHLLGAGHANSAQRRALSGLSRWKLFDNLRRSLVPAALTSMLLLGWAVLPLPWLWTFSVIAIVFVPSLCAVVLDVFRKPNEMLLRQHLNARFDTVHRSLSNAAFTIICLPYEAFYSLDAIVRTIWRLLISHRHLLEWSPSSNDKRPAKANSDDIVATYYSMWIAPAVAAMTLVYLTFERPIVLIVAVPVLFLWGASPGITWWLSRTLERAEAKLSTHQTIFLRELSRRTWAFFDTFVGAEDNWLPPDNYQKRPVPVVAHRTSPTNMGLSLLANLAAYDFGYVSAGELVERTANALQTMQGLERYRGHFYNWYDTQTLKPLAPIYISTVDSGNLAGHLLTLRPGLLALADDKVMDARLFEGLHDTLRILIDVGAKLPLAALGLLLQFQRDLESVMGAPQMRLATMHVHLQHMASIATDLVAHVESDAENEASMWALALARQCRGLVNELNYLTPWLLLPSAPPGCERLNNAIRIDDAPTLRELTRLDTLLSSTLTH
ncbi:MAG TPA: cyclic beta 1-2 glucan synthetase, partial [Rhodocyclaceae bacterium]|nr:cyclic beta 1-2 glucan synthetase [Rhodocyclaceae bacterium]